MNLPSDGKLISGAYHHEVAVNSGYTYNPNSLWSFDAIVFVLPYNAGLPDIESYTDSFFKELANT